MVTPTFYLFYGSDTLSIDEAVGKLRESMGDDANADLNTSEFDGEAASVPEIIGAVSSYPFLADKRLVIVKGLVGWLTRKGAGKTGKAAMEQLLDELPHLPEYARLVLVEYQNLRDNSKIVKLASEQGFCKAFHAPKDSTSWIIQRAKDEYEVEIEPRAANALATVTGDDLRRADNELVKLVSYVDGERAISEDDVAALTPYVPEANIFAMVDALAAGKGEEALALMHRLLDDPREEGFRLYGMIIRQFRLLLLTREHLDGGGSSRGADIAGAIGVRSAWQADKFARLSRRFTIEELERIYRKLQEYDEQAKTGRIDIKLALDLLVASLTKSV